MTDFLQQAMAQHQRGNLRDAERLYRAALEQQPHQLDAMALLGVLLGALGQHSEAMALTSQAALDDPASALFEFHRGTVLMNAKHLAEAVVAFRRAIRLNPSMGQAYFNLGNALRAQGEWTGAILAYRDAIRVFPEFAEGYNNLALSLVHEKAFSDALQCAQKSVHIDPHYGEAWRTLCNIAEQAGDYELARTAGQRCTELVPDSHFAWFGYGVALCRLDRYEEAIPVYRRALELKPDRADIWDNLGQTYQSLNRLDEAESTFRTTVEVAGQKLQRTQEHEALEHEYGNRHWHLALMELLRGKYLDGFARYRSRFEDVGGLKRPNLSRPLWKGEALQGKTILITDEQGFGDTLMLCRYLPLIKDMGARIKFSVHPVLKPLFELWPGADEILVHGSSVSDYDFYASVFDLPHLFRTTLDSIPQNIPYLSAPEKKPFIVPKDARKSVGVVWGGSPRHTNDRRRSVPLKLFANLFGTAGVRFFSLNRDMKEGDEEILSTLALTDCLPFIQDFNDAAAIIDQLDLVITCDTATAHLAGAMGKKTWVLLPFAPDWRWLTERTDSPWYPTARLFRQHAIGRWDGALDDVQRALNTFVLTT